MNLEWFQTNHVGFSCSYGGKELLRMMLAYKEPKLGSRIPMVEINYYVVGFQWTKVRFIDSHVGKELLQCWVPINLNYGKALIHCRVPMNPNWVLRFPCWKEATMVLGSNEPKLGYWIPIVGKNKSGYCATMYGSWQKLNFKWTLWIGSWIPVVGIKYYIVRFQ